MVGLDFNRDRTLIEPPRHVFVVGQHRDGILEQLLLASVVASDARCALKPPKLLGIRRRPRAVDFYPVEDLDDILGSIRPIEQTRHRLLAASHSASTA